MQLLSSSCGAVEEFAEWAAPRGRRAPVGPGVGWVVQLVLSAAARGSGLGCNP